MRKLHFLLKTCTNLERSFKTNANNLAEKRKRVLYSKCDSTVRLNWCLGLRVGCLRFDLSINHKDHLNDGLCPPFLAPSLPLPNPGAVPEDGAASPRRVFGPLRREFYSCADGRECYRHPPSLLLPRHKRVTWLSRERRQPRRHVVWTVNAALRPRPSHPPDVTGIRRWWWPCLRSVLLLVSTHASGVFCERTPPLCTIPTLS